MTRSAAAYRPDVQGLRALAVTLVVVYHIWPSAIPGGYVGVDVFFVISGFLITGLLARTVRRSGRVKLLEFYGRRARRLMPAAALVLAVTWVVSRAVLPVTQLPAAAQQIRASALYFQNIVLADDAVDYLKADESPSPVQHFWSLSVEEQFYLVWPLVFVLAAAIGWLLSRRRPRPQGAHRRLSRGPEAWYVPALLLGAAVVAVSFWYSLHETAANPAAAYYVTPTRIWELGAGGLLALAPARVTDRVGRLGVLAWLGAAAILYTAFAYSGATAFPGRAALLPVLGAVALLASGGPTARLSPAVLTATRPAVWLGGISYSLYLWHWPVAVLYQAYRGHHGLGLTGGVGVIALSIGLAWLTKRFVEDPVREARVVTKSSLRSLATVGLAAVPVLLASIWLSNQNTAPQHVDAQHPGAASVASGTSPVPTHAPAAPTLTQAVDDLPVGITSKCEASKAATSVQSCVLGDTTDPVKTVALVGDSHAGQWSDALDAVAKQQHWKLFVATKSQCPFTATEVALVGVATPYTSCTSWNKQVLAQLLTTVKPDVVVASDRPIMAVLPDQKADANSLTKIGEGLATQWKTLRAHHIGVVGIAETPQTGSGAGIPDCLAAKGGSVASCSRLLSEALPDTLPVTVAARSIGQPSAVVDLTDLLCPKGVCEPVIGNLVVYSDSHHLTSSYTESLAPYLAERMLATPAFRTSSG